MARPRRPIASVINASLTALALVGLFVVQAYFVGGAGGLLPATHAEMPAFAAAVVPGEAVCGAARIDIKNDEQGMLMFC